MEKIDLSICDFPDIIFDLSAYCFKWGFYITVYHSVLAGVVSLGIDSMGNACINDPDKQKEWWNYNYLFIHNSVTMWV